MMHHHTKFEHGIFRTEKLFLFSCFCQVLLWLASRSKYNTSIVNYLLVFCTLSTKIYIKKRNYGTKFQFEELNLHYHFEDNSPIYFLLHPMVVHHNTESGCKRWSDLEYAVTPRHGIVNRVTPLPTPPTSKFCFDESSDSNGAKTC